MIDIFNKQIKAETTESNFCNPAEIFLTDTENQYQNIELFWLIGSTG